MKTDLAILVPYFHFYPLVAYSFSMRVLPIVLQALLGVFCVVLMGGIAYGYTLYQTEVQAVVQVQGELASTTAAYEAKIEERNTALSNTQISLTEEQQKTSLLGEQVADITSTAEYLRKLTHTDPQLLAKYSKVYFLNENYSPETLGTITPSETLVPTKEYQFQAQALPFLETMVAAAKNEGINLLVVSSFRSFGTQAALKSSYTVRYGTTASNSFSADQGYSEHQLGTTIDFSTIELKGVLAGFSKTTAYEWLLLHAHEYGFILSYPANNGYYVYEPWHWRFVGKKLATDLYNEKKNFYSLDQRKINTYLINLFDQ